MPNPVLVEVTRGGYVESLHRGAIAIADLNGRSVFALGDVEQPVYPRSALKPIQALPLLESGAADAFGLSDEEIALACASHSGEAMHTERVNIWLRRIGCSEADLACGAHPPRYTPLRDAMIRHGEQPNRLHNNCSGKHAGFLTVARHWGIATDGYERADHPVQQAVKRALQDLSGVNDLPFGIDGCTAPNFMLPLSGFARALAKFTGTATDARGQAMHRIVHAMIAHPELVSGTGRACAALMQGCDGQAAVKTGAEGVYAAILPERGLGIALKIDDGATRAAETAIATMLDRLGVLGRDAPARTLIHTPVRNTRDTIVGECRATGALTELRPTGL